MEILNESTIWLVKEELNNRLINCKSTEKTTIMVSGQKSILNSIGF